MATSHSETPAASKSQWTRWRWVLMALALSVVIFRGMSATGSLFGQTQSAYSPASRATAILPTLAPAQPQITPAQYADSIISHMTLNDEIAQMIMIKLYGSIYSDSEAQMVKSQHVGAVLAFGDAIQTPPQVRSLTSTLKSNAYLPLWVATDQEGGYVNRFQPLVGSRPGEQQIGNTHQPANATTAGEQTAADFANFGFNFDLAPVVDINEPGVTTSQLYGRMYSTDPNAIATMANAYLIGLQQNGTIMGTLKHFPGLGASPVDPHNTIVPINKTQAELDAHEFVPYRDLLAQGNVQAIMVTHEYLPKIDAKYPATLSYKIMTGLLRGDLGFQGLIVTDSLDMTAIAAQYTIGEAATLAAEAGADVLMGPSTPEGVQDCITDIAAAVSAGQLTKARIDDSVRRILVQKISQGMIPLPQTTLTPTVTAPGATPAAHAPTATPSRSTPPVLTHTPTITPTKQP